MVEVLLNGSHRASSWADWEIVGAGGRMWIGKVVNESADRTEVTLSPVYLYGVQAAQTPGGVQIVREAMVIDFFPSSAPERLRWSSRRRVDQHDADDQQEIRKLIANAEEIRKKIQAQRSGLSLVSAMPAKLPTPIR